MGMDNDFYVGMGQFVNQEKCKVDLWDDRFDDLPDTHNGLTIIHGENIHPDVFIGKIYASGYKYDENLRVDLSEFLSKNQSIIDWQETVRFLLHELKLPDSELKVRPMFFNAIG